MKKYKVQQFSNKFCELGLVKGDVLLIHNSLLSFGIPSDCKINEVPSRIFNEIENTIGEEGTIAVPTFNFDFCKGLVFNRQETPSQNMGVFSEYVRKLPQAKRSQHAMQSISVVGAQSSYVIENDTESAFSPKGSFDKLREIDGKILLLGADFNSVSLIHWVEEKYEVPYRYWKTFTGSYIDTTTPFEKSYKMFVRSQEINPILKLYSIEKELKKRNKIREVHVGGGLIKVFEIKDFIAVAEHFIVQNPYFFVSNHPSFEKL